jgi:hypothetical protein
MHLDPDFDARIEGHIYAQPLFWHNRQTGRKLVIVATEDDLLYDLDARTAQVAMGLGPADRRSTRRDLPSSRSRECSALRGSHMVLYAQRRQRHII